MAVDPRLRRLANKALPRPAVERLASVAAGFRRWADTRKLAGAPERFFRAYASYWDSGIVPNDADELLFLATWSTDGLLPGTQARERGRPFSATPFTAFPSDLLAGIDPAEAAAALEQDGLYLPPQSLDGGVVDELLATLEAGPAQPRGDGLAGRPGGRPEPTAPTWWMAPKDSMRSLAVRRLLVERNLAETGGRYLGVDPVIMSVVLWKSFPWGRPDKSSAQAFHYDNDRPAFLKMFVYLTDVTSGTGPHVYVPGSHRRKPRQLLDGQRLSDEDVARYYERSRWRAITGRRGTVFFADTKGFHKGSQVEDAPRAILQINLASDRFGIDEPAIGTPEAAPPDLMEPLRAAPRYFSQYFPPTPPVP